MGSDQLLEMPGFWASLRRDIEQLNATLESYGKGVKVYLVLVLTVIPFSLFLVGVAMGQSEAMGFFLWMQIACLVAGLPFAVVMTHQYGLENLIVDFDENTDQTDGIPSDGQAFVTQEPVPFGVNAYRPTLSLEDAEWEAITTWPQPERLTWQGWTISHAAVLNQQSEVPMILIHGFGGSIGHWRQNMAVLGQHHSVYAIDLLGFGASDKPDTAYSLNLWADQVYEYWRSHIRTPAVLVGNSLGSLTCLALASRHPEMVRGIVMISLPDISAQQEAMSPSLRWAIDKIHQFVLNPIILQPLFHLLRQPWVVRQWAKVAYACGEAITDELLEILLKPAQEKGAARAFCAILKAILGPQCHLNVPAILSQLKIPSLLLWGKCDRMVPSQLARRYLQYSSSLSLVELDDAGHCAHDECPDRVNGELLNWIRNEVMLTPVP